MPELATKDYKSVPVPRRVKISSKRQITIPVDIYERHGFAQYALLTETAEGLVVQPLNLTADDEVATVKLLEYLVAQGCEGDDLIAKYTELKPLFASYYTAIQQSEDDIAAGRVLDFDAMQDSVRSSYGL